MTRGVSGAAGIPAPGQPGRARYRVKQTYSIPALKDVEKLYSGQFAWISPPGIQSLMGGCTGHR